jgi:hypothetical protein
MYYFGNGRDVGGIRWDSLKWKRTCLQEIPIGLKLHGERIGNL